MPRVAARGRTEALEAGIELTELQKTMPETEPGGLIVGYCHQRAPKIFGGRFVLAQFSMRFRDPEQCVGGARGNLEGTAKGDLGFSAFSAREQGVTELDGELRHHRCDFEPATERIDRLVVTPHGNQETTEFMIGRCVRWLPLGRALEASERIVRPAGLAQRDRELRIDGRIMAAASGVFERCDCILSAALHQQRTAEDVQRLSMPRLGLKNVAGNPLCFVWVLVVERVHGAPKRVIAAAGAASGRRRMSGSVLHHYPK